MSKIRTIVSTHYRFSEFSDVRPLIQELLEKDNFTCQDWKKVTLQDLWKKELT
jgi:hypothetical protein